MKQVLKVLIIEDNPDDVELIVRTLERANFQIEFESVDTWADLDVALKNPNWDFILSDYNLPTLNGSQALELSSKKRPGIPFIFISGAIGEEKAVDLMHLGARDFVSKANLKRLIPTIHRELAAQNRADLLEKELLSTLETMSEGLLTLDRNWTVTYVNYEAIKYLQIPKDEILGKSLKQLYPLPDIEKFLIRYRRVLDNGTPEKFVESYQDRTLHIHAIPTAAGGISVFFRNITDQVEAEQKKLELLKNLETAKEEAERANQLKSAFLANMSHEIRTPLGAILGFADLLKDPEISPDDLHSYVNIIARSGNQLSHLINDILDLSKVESGHLAVDKVSVHLLEAAKDVIDLLQIKAKEKSIELSLSVDGDTPKNIFSDPIRLKQILTNIIGNAIKFTQQGYVRVHLFKISDIQVGIKVSDSGIGIAAKDQAHLFQVFRQADDSVARKFGGTGLGLALSRRLAQLLGGDIVLAKSEPRTGSTFVISVATNDFSLENKKSVDLKKDAAHPVETGRRLKILLIDDSPDNQFLISRILKKLEAEIELANDGHDGIQKALNGHHDIVLMDIQMPNMDGYTATQQLRESGYTKPIIALTAHAMSEIRVKCLNVGFTDYLTKPIDRNLLFEALGRHT